MNGISDFKVLRSGAGYYIGRTIGGHIPYSRDSREYWKTQEEATEALLSGKWTLRSHP